MFPSVPMPMRRGSALLIALTLVLGAIVPFVAPAPARAATPVFINEIHYDNVSTDSGEAIEVAGPAGTNLSGWDIVLYNGANGEQYGSDELLGPIPNQQNGFGTVLLTYPSNGIQNGSPDGVALVDATDTVVQFLSYEGTFTAVDGPAVGMVSTDIDVAEGAGTEVGHSLQLVGVGTTYEDFTWEDPEANTFGAVNTGQTFGTVANAPVVADCGEALITAEGEEASTTMSATDADGSVTDIAITDVTPSDANITIGTTTPAPSDGGEATAVVTVGAATAAGSYAVEVTATNDDAEPQTGTCTLSVTVEGAGAAPASIVISQVYGGGGNAGATYTNDFIELFNRTDAPVSLVGWSVQYAARTGTSWQVTALDGSIAAGGYYLIQQAAGDGGTTPLPTPDATGTITMAGPSGKVALSRTTTTLSGSCPLGDPVVDFVGYGSAANCFEGDGPTGTLSNTTAAIRVNDGATDTDNNNADFVVGDPNPRNSGGVDPDPDPDPVAVCDVEESDLTPIYAVQGDGATTPMAGESVIVRGVVIADFTSGGDSGIDANQGLRGFFMEAIAIDRDDDDQTSEGVFVFDFGGIFDGEIGDLVHVAGTAGEFADVTQISSGDLDVCDDTGVDAELPATAVLPLPLAPDDRAVVLEPLESMRVTHEELTVIEFFQVERFGEIRLSAEGVLQTPTNVFLPGSEEAVELAEFNAAANIVLDDGRTGQNLNRLDSPDLLPYVEAGETLRIGDQLIDHTTVLHFGFGQWRLQPVDIDAITAELAENRTRQRPESAPDVGGTLNIASFNVLNYFDGDGQGGGFPNARGATTASELARQTEKLVDAITRLDADILGLIEIENDGGEFTATRTLVDAINAELGAEVYRFVDTGVIGTDAIKQAFIYDRRTVRPVGEWEILTSEVDPRFDDSRSRPALAQTFTQLGTGERVTVAVNHFKSKGQSGMNDPNDPDFDQGDGQGFWNHTRTQSALALADWLDTNPTRVQSLGTLIIGDLNAYGREDPIRALEDAGYVDQLIQFTEGTPYTFTFDGQQGTLDTALAKGNLGSRITGADIWHINADEVPAIDYQESIGGPGNSRFRTPEIAAAYYDPSAFRSSDHDPVLVGLDLGRRHFPGRSGR